MPAIHLRQSRLFHGLANEWAIRRHQQLRGEFLGLAELLATLVPLGQQAPEDNHDHEADGQADDADLAHVEETELEPGLLGEQAADDKVGRRADHRTQASEHRRVTQWD